MHFNWLELKIKSCDHKSMRFKDKIKNHIFVQLITIENNEYPFLYIVIMTFYLHKIMVFYVTVKLEVKLCQYLLT